MHSELLRPSQDTLSMDMLVLVRACLEKKLNTTPAPKIQAFSHNIMFHNPMYNDIFLFLC